MANTIVITAITSQGGDSIIVQGTVNGVASNANASRAVIGSFATAVLADNYLAYLLLHNCPQGVTQGALIATTGTVTL
jgi:hypothetical protein